MRGMEKTRRQVRAERVDTACGDLGHMTVDEIKRRSVGRDVNLSCPVCGGVHLTREDAQEAAERRLTDTPRYRHIRKQAEAG